MGKGKNVRGEGPKEAWGAGCGKRNALLSVTPREERGRPANSHTESFGEESSSDKN